VRRWEEAGFSHAVRQVLCGIWIASAFVQVRLPVLPLILLTDASRSVPSSV
jgi:hypothetical protein